jgi:hypothetical protein
VTIAFIFPPSVAHASSGPCHSIVVVARGWGGYFQQIIHGLTVRVSYHGISLTSLAVPQALARLEALPGDQLVIVRYNQYHNLDNEWVYNRADIDAAKTVWARDRSDAGNAELTRYFPHRRLWLEEPDLAPPKLSPYPAPGGRRLFAPAPGTPGN